MGEVLFLSQSPGPDSPDSELFFHPALRRRRETWIVLEAQRAMGLRNWNPFPPYLRFARRASYVPVRVEEADLKETPALPPSPEAEKPAPATASVAPATPAATAPGYLKNSEAKVEPPTQPGKAEPAKKADTKPANEPLSLLRAIDRLGKNAVHQICETQANDIINQIVGEFVGKIAQRTFTETKTQQAKEQEAALAAKRAADLKAQKHQERKSRRELRKNIADVVSTELLEDFITDALNEIVSSSWHEAKAERDRLIQQELEEKRRLERAEKMKADLAERAKVQAELDRLRLAAEKKAEQQRHSDAYSDPYSPPGLGSPRRPPGLLPNSGAWDGPPYPDADLVIDEPASSFRSLASDPVWAPPATPAGGNSSFNLWGSYSSSSVSAPSLFPAWSDFTTPQKLRCTNLPPGTTQSTLLQFLGIRNPLGVTSS
jgi:hypothetical protein